MLPEVNVKYELKVWVDELLVYEDDFYDSEDLQGAGLRKADHAIHEFQKEKAQEILEEQIDQAELDDPLKN